MEAEQLFAVFGVAAGLGAAVVSWVGGRAVLARRDARLSTLNDDLLSLLRLAAAERPQRKPTTASRQATRKTA